MVTGAGGQLGATMVRAFSDRAVIAHTHASLNVTSAEAVSRAVAAARPDVIVNCAAFNDVDGAADRPSEELAVNAFALRGLARAAGDADATLVHFGTDFVFDGTANEPYTEAVPPSPRSAYAISKLLGEWFALEAPRAFLLRVESLFGMPTAWTGRRGTLEGIGQGLEQGRNVRVFTDRVVSPSYVDDVVGATRHLVDNDAPPGLYHCVNSGNATWYDVAQEMGRLLGVVPRLQPITMDQVALKAERPRFCALANGKLAAAGFPMPSWQDALERWVAARRHIQ